MSLSDAARRRALDEIASGARTPARDPRLRGGDDELVWDAPRGREAENRLNTYQITEEEAEAARRSRR